MTAEEYLTQHDINNDAVKRFGLTWDESFLSIPIKDENGNTIWIKSRNLNFDIQNTDSPKYKNSAGSKATLFNLHNISESTVVVLTEGEMDTIRLAQDGIPAVSVTAGAETFNAEFAEKLSGKSVYICYDNDDAGTKGTRKVLEFLPDAKVVSLPEGSKDICEYFASGKTREDFVGLLQKAISGKEWLTKNPIEEYSTISLAKLYEKEFPPEAFIIDKFVPTMGMTMISGDAGVGKSFVALDIVKSIVMNTKFLGNFAVNMPDVGILIIDKENGLKRLQKRARGMGIDPSDKVHILRYPEKFTLEDGKFMQALQDFIIVNEIKVVILDSFVDVLIGNENSSTDVTTAINALRSIASDICWVILHHEAKPVPRFQRSVSDRARGSSGIKAQVDYLFSLQKTKDLKVIHIEQGKARDYEIVNKFAVEFESNNEGEMVGFKYLGEVEDTNSAVDKAASFVTDFLASDPGRSRQEIVDVADSMGISEASVKRALKMLEEKKIIVSRSDPKKRSRKLFYLLDDSEVDFEDSEPEQNPTDIFDGELPL